MRTRLIVFLFLVMCHPLARASDERTERLIEALLERECRVESSLFPEVPAVVVVPVTVIPDTPWKRLLEQPPASIRIRDRFVPVNPVTPATASPTVSIPRWKFRQQIRSLDLARRYAPVYGTGTGVK